ncbi:MAG: hypothetical protein M3Q70_01770 [bacterium]|nr:hypothetical protein [bacterium]
MADDPNKSKLKHTRQRTQENKSRFKQIEELVKQASSSDLNPKEVNCLKTIIDREQETLDSAINDNIHLINVEDKKTDNLLLVGSLIQVFGVLLLSVLWAQRDFNFIHQVSIQYYSTIVQLIPVFVIAIYFSSDRKFVSSSLKYLISDLLFVVFPAVLGIITGLIAIATNQSSFILFILSTYAVANLLLALCAKIVIQISAKL